MKKLLVIFLILAASFFLFRHLVKTNLALNAKWAHVTDGVNSARTAIQGFAKDVTKNVRSSSRKIGSLKDKLDLQETSDKAVKIYLKHGGIIEGKLLKSGKDGYTVDWKGQPFEVLTSQIKRIEYKTEKETAWPYKNDVVIKKINGVILDGKIVSADDNALTASFNEGGGEMEMTIPRKDIDHLIFAPVYNKQSQEIEANLKAQFPKMKIYKEGNVTIFTDSYDTWVKRYQKTVRMEYTDIYMKFFKLFDGRKPQNQNFIVIFDNFNDYVEYAMTDGVPGWLAIGYFSPVNKVLYLFNAFGEKMEKMVFEVIVGKTGKSIDEVVKMIKARVDERYHEFIDGKVKELTDRYWDVYSLYKNELTDMTFSVLRHEFTHELFCNWGLQNIIVSKPNINNKKLIDKKKEILAAKDWKKKEELLLGLMKMKKPEEDIEIESAQSWLNEGMATYCETEPMGAADEGRLFAFQEMERQGNTNPIEFITSFKVGSFRGLNYKAKLDAYAESWAFTTFLINKYPDKFMEYQVRAAGRAEDKTDEFELLLKTLGRDLPTIEKEFKEYMNTYKKVEDPDVARFMKYYSIWSDLLQSRG